MKTTKKMKSISAIMIILLIIQMIPVQSFAASSSESSESESKITISEENEENPKIIAEADDEREECVKHYINSDGSFSAVSYLNPIHFKKNGTWNDINNNLSLIKDDRTGQEDAVYVPKDSPVDIRLKKVYGENAISITNKGHVLSWSYSVEGEGKEYVQLDAVTAGKKEKKYCNDKGNPNDEFTTLKN